MEKICIVDQNRCPICGQRMIIVDNQCKFCNVEIRKININRIRNSDFLRGVCKYDVHGNLVHMIIPGLFEPPVRTLRATIPENESHIFR